MNASQKSKSPVIRLPNRRIQNREKRRSRRIISRIRRYLEVRLCLCRDDNKPPTSCSSTSTSTSSETSGDARYAGRVLEGGLWVGAGGEERWDRRGGGCCRCAGCCGVETTGVERGERTPRSSRKALLPRRTRAGSGTFMDVVAGDEKNVCGRGRM